MDDSGNRLGRSSPTNYQLPSFSSLRSNVGYQASTTHARRGSFHDAASNDANSSLTQQLHGLRAERDRLQTLCEQLETKSRIMDQELAALNEERAGLRKQTNGLASQVESLTKEREQLQHQSQADAAQWRQIMSMSSKLQMQSVEETRRFNAEREAWTRERAVMEERLSRLQGGLMHRTDTEESSGTSSELRRSLTLSSMSDDQLRQEVGSLRKRCTELEGLMSAVVKESASIERTGSVLREVRRRIVSTAALTLDDNDSDQGSREL